MSDVKGLSSKVFTVFMSAVVFLSTSVASANLHLSKNGSSPVPCCALKCCCMPKQGIGAGLSYGSMTSTVRIDISAGCAAEQKLVSISLSDGLFLPTFVVNLLFQITPPYFVFVHIAGASARQEFS